MFCVPVHHVIVVRMDALDVLCTGTPCNRGANGRSCTRRTTLKKEQQMNQKQKRACCVRRRIPYRVDPVGGHVWILPAVRSTTGRFDASVPKRPHLRGVLGRHVVVPFVWRGATHSNPRRRRRRRGRGDWGRGRRERGEGGWWRVEVSVDETRETGRVEGLSGKNMGKVLHCCVLGLL